MPSAKFIALFFWLGLAGLTWSAERLPPAPTRYFNDYANVVSSQTARQLEQTLQEFKEKTSSQIVVAIFPNLPANAALEDYAVRVFQAWKPGQQERDNGVILFVFVQDRLMRIEVGYGLEGALPDALAKRIIDDEIKPRFRRGDFDGGVTAGVAAILQAVRGEYKGTGSRGRDSNTAFRFLPILFILLLAIFIASRRRRGTVYHRGGPIPWGGWAGSGRSGGWSSGGRGGWSSGGGFSGGGGRSGGGGASGSW